MQEFGLSYSPAGNSMEKRESHDVSVTHSVIHTPPKYNYTLLSISKIGINILFLVWIAKILRERKKYLSSVYIIHQRFGIYIFFQIFTLTLENYTFPLLLVQTSPNNCMLNILPCKVFYQWTRLFFSLLTCVVFIDFLGHLRLSFIIHWSHAAMLSCNTNPAILFLVQCSLRWVLLLISRQQQCNRSICVTSVPVSAVPLHSLSPCVHWVLFFSPQSEVPVSCQRADVMAPVLALLAP